MKIGMLGSGDVAQALAVGFLKRGDEVMLGTRDAGKLAAWKSSAGDRASVGSFAHAADYGEIVVLATHGTSTLDVIESAGEGSFHGKVVIDATNPIRVIEGKGPQLAIGFDDSLGERIQGAVPNAHVVKAFNTVGAPHMVDPQFAGGPPTMFIGGNDAAAKQTVTKILSDFGWETADLGGIEVARYLEPMCLAWIAYGIRSGGWNHAFKMLVSE